MSWMLLADGPGYSGLFADFDTTFWSAVLRIAQAMVAAAPFLVAGVVVAGLLRGMVGTKRVRAILGVGHWTGPLRAWALGILLPICSLGAIPVARGAKAGWHSQRDRTQLCTGCTCVESGFDYLRLESHRTQHVGLVCDWNILRVCGNRSRLEPSGLCQARCDHGGKRRRTCR